MVNSRPSRNLLYILALAVICFGLTPVAKAQGPDPAKRPVVLGQKQAARLMVKQVKPAYPPLAKLNYIQGRVRVELAVSSQGKVAHAHILSGHALLAAATLEAVRQWIFRPLMTSSRPTPFITAVELHFALQTHKPHDVPATPVRDFDRQVKPPVVVTQPQAQSKAPIMHLRLLLDEDGHVIDVKMMSGSAGNLDMVQRALEGWTFRPARWGALAIPWYIEVKVPVGDAGVHQAAADSPSR